MPTLTLLCWHADTVSNSFNSAPTETEVWHDLDRSCWFCLSAANDASFRFAVMMLMMMLMLLQLLLLSIATRTVPRTVPPRSVASTLAAKHLSSSRFAAATTTQRRTDVLLILT